MCALSDTNCERRGVNHNDDSIFLHCARTEGDDNDCVHAFDYSVHTSGLEFC